jgi:hypothetical protein
MDNEAFTRIPLSISPDVVRTTSAAPGFSPCLSVSLAYAETDRGPHFRSAAEPDAPCASVPAVIGACQAHAALLQRWGDRRAGGTLRLMASMWYRPSFAVRNTCNGATIKSRDWKGTSQRTDMGIFLGSYPYAAVRWPHMTLILSTTIQHAHGIYQEY